MGFLKKLFGGRDNGKSADGTTIYTYEDVEKPEDYSVAPMKYIDEIAEHFDKVFPDRNSSVFHELISETVHIDVNIMAPNEEQPFWVLYTNGMSDLPMTMPDDMPEELREEYSLAEVMMFLPEDWKLSEENLKDENYYWPIRLMKMMARFPHQYHTWLGYGHTVPNYAEYEPYAENTGLNGVVFYQLKEEISEIRTSDGNLIHVYFLLPLYKEEMEYKLEHGMDELLNRLEELDNGILVLDPLRRNTCASKE